MKPPSPLLLQALRHACAPAPALARSSTCLVSRRHARHSSSTAPKPTRSASQPSSVIASRPPSSIDRGPVSTETTQTDFGALNVLGSLTPPSTAVEACLPDGFHLDNGIDIRGGSGCLLVQGEAFRWRPWEAGAGCGSSDTRGTELPPPGAMLNAKGQWEVAAEAWGLLECVWPKPELLVLGLGSSMHQLAPTTKEQINALGIRVDIQDTRNAAAQFNLLATERGVGTIAAALIPLGWKGR